MMAKSSSKPSMDEQAKFVFHGTVKKVGAATAGLALADKKNLAVVHVDEIVRSPEVLRGVVGRDITVQLGEKEKVKNGEQATFYTKGWLFGQSIAVQSVGHEKVARPKVTAAIRAAAPAHSVAAFQSQAIEHRAEGAKLVVSGRVVAVGAPATTRTLAARASDQSGPISEHAPFWTEAVVEVDGVHKGKTDAKHVVVRFPGSTDVRWHKAPKFKVGDEGVFMLRDDNVSGGTRASASLGRAAAAMASPGDKYTCLNESDFLPGHDAAAVASAINASSA
jgi:hypothetical protein